MRKVAIIPLRSGSKGIKNKNRKKILGRPLFTWTLAAAIESKLDHVYVFTDDQKVIDFINKDYGWTEKVSVVERSTESASDTASTEMAMLELAEKINYDFTHYFLLQATSPLTTAADIDKAIEVLEQGADSVISVVKTHRFIWKSNGESINYDYLNRPRRQDFDGLLIENGSIYGCSKAVFTKTKNRLGGKIQVMEMPEDTLTEIDEPTDLILIEQLLRKRLLTYKKPVKAIKYLVLDVDGVFTDATAAYDKNGELSKQFSLFDGMGLEILREHHVEPIIMTSENSELVKRRMEKLQINKCFLGVKDKFAFLNNLIKELNVNRNELAYLGDDINDLANILSVGWGACPLNAASPVRNAADIKLTTYGGKGAIREFVEFIIGFNSRI
ncbi:acylneuraminate cytidylyltransferase [Carboxylicivirga mesophila]|uniref:N-acylneuraminate cytidylyltransferase n=1 Tax=Carboxylicivirga mesophila TaxID=1166478 RepID=A0ABS5K4Z9_9BACT|nr:acylneuraminate cytidylyltransferase [Carboxylicivirga mesophila]